ncbi:exported protein of unknown function [Agreia sp. COWG]|nr:exported protein of unknown function [Agreia sp. COWG]CAD6010876.1 exported protein of unknown function [Agreia sp. COWG]
MTAPFKLQYIASGVLAVAAALTVAGCATVNPTPTPRANMPPTNTEQSCSSSALAPLGCVTFESHGDVDVSGTVRWLASDPIAVSFDMQNGAPTMIISTTCNAINVPVTITATQIVPDMSGLSLGTRGCVSLAADDEAWTTEFVSSPMDYTLSGDELRLDNSNGTVQLARRRP